VEYPEVGTAATDGLRIMYNEKFMKSLITAERNFVFMHEVFHVLLMHTSRKKDRDPKLWNVAADIMVNDMLLNKLAAAMNEAGIPFKAPAKGVFASVNYSQSIEDIYAALVEDNRNKNSKSDKITVRASYGPYFNPSKQEIIPSEDLRPEDITITIGDCEPGGDCMTGRYHSIDELLSDEKLKELVQGLVREASTRDNAGRSGTGSYFVPAAVLDLTVGKTLNWKTMLKRFVESKQSDDSSYATPERKYLHMDLILPGHCEDEEVIEEVWGFVDTSGSISQDQLQSFLRQLYVIVKDCGCTLNLAYWDTQVTEVYRGISKAKDLENAMPHHSGGTDINCVYAWMEKEKVKPDVMVILTDGYYGMLKKEYIKPSLQKKTIQVFNSTMPETDNIKAIGRVTYL